MAGEKTVVEWTFIAHTSDIASDIVHLCSLRRRISTYLDNPRRRVMNASSKTIATRLLRAFSPVTPTDGWCTISHTLFSDIDTKITTLDTLAMHYDTQDIYINNGYGICNLQSRLKLTALNSQSQTNLSHRTLKYRG